MANFTSRVLGLAGLLSAMHIARPASAYDFNTHAALVRAALTAAYWVGETGSTQWCPNTGELPNTTDFNNFVAAIKSSRTSLNGLQTGLKGVASDVSNCPYYSDDNLTNMGSFLIRDFRYYVKGGYDQPCGLEPIPQGVLDQYGWRTLGSILGTQAGDVDNLPRDVVAWFRPTNSGFAEQIKDGASKFWDVTIGVTLLPFAAFASIFSGHNIWDTASSWSHSTDPVDYVDGWIPGIPYSLVGDDTEFNGLWHFIEANSTPGPRGRYNNPSGMYYPNAGPQWDPGELDDDIIDFTSATGLSLNSRSSDGVSNYAPFDDDTRNWIKWQAHVIGLTEFSPVDNLARYGQKVYDDNNAYGFHLSAFGLGWPLHALGDASVPMHVANTTSWGHRPYEDAVNDIFPYALRFETDAPKAGSPGQDYFTDCHRAVEIVLKAYSWWQQYGMANGNHIDIADLVGRVASNSRMWIDSHQNVYNDDLSVTYQFGPASDSSKNHQDATTGYLLSDFGGGTKLQDFAAPLLLESSAAMLAYLVDEGQFVWDQQANPNTKCPPNTHFVFLQGCQPGAGATPPPTASMFVPNCSTNGQHCTGASDCCSGLRCLMGTPTLGTCSTQGTAGDSCSKDADCSGSLVCGTTNQCCVSEFSGGACQQDSDCCPGANGNRNGVMCFENACIIIG
jgi:hypothetical protein